MKKNKKAFTLIELIVVLVILAVIALIATPIILNIVDKAQISANKRSVDAYGKAVELAIAEYLLDTGEYPTSIDDLEVEYSGNAVECKIIKFQENNGLYLSECSVDGVIVKDDSTEDGYYHYNSNSYKTYEKGDKVTYNGIEFYVIENSDRKEESVTLLKAEPLTVDEVNKYGIDESGVNHINKYTSSYVGTAENSGNHGYGIIAYYSSATCGYIGRKWVTTGCDTTYDTSDIKYVVDAWSIDKLQTSDLKEDSLSYKVRLITIDELVNNLGYDWNITSSGNLVATENVSEWVYNSSYWTMSQSADYTGYMMVVSADGYVQTNPVCSNGVGYGITDAVRPVITLLKSAI